MQPDYIKGATNKESLSNPYLARASAILVANQPTWQKTTCIEEDEALISLK